jgi:hypothetical protein
MRHCTNRKKQHDRDRDRDCDHATTSLIISFHDKPYLSTRDAV